MAEINSDNKNEPISRKPLVFISHDTRDADLAEAFSKLLSSVSAGVLKSFRSSDKKGNQGIEYGVEWYPEIMKRLQDATSVVCLLTQNSLNRPWILFEAGVAKGKLDTSILGICIGIQLSQANNGPFAQFQNCGDDEDSLTKLVLQLVKTIPNSEPDEQVIKGQVDVFKQKISTILKPTTEKNITKAKSKAEDTSAEKELAIASLYEEMKIMLKELPSKIQNNVSYNNLNPRKFKGMPIGAIDEILHYSSQFDTDTSIRINLELCKNEFPWIYEVGIQTLNASKRMNLNRIEELYMNFERILEITHRNMRLENYDEYYRFLFDRLNGMMRKHFDRVMSRRNSPKMLNEEDVNEQ